MRTLHWALPLLGLWPELGGAAEPPVPEDEAAARVSPARQWCYLARLEATGLALLPRAGLGAEERFAQTGLPSFLCFQRSARAPGKASAGQLHERERAASGRGLQAQGVAMLSWRTFCATAF
jgi:hypothetical protein